MIFFFSWQPFSLFSEFWPWCVCGFFFFVFFNIHPAHNFLDLLKPWIHLSHWFWKPVFCFSFRFFLCYSVYCLFMGLSLHILGHWTASQISWPSVFTGSPSVNSTNCRLKYLEKNSGSSRKQSLNLACSSNFFRSIIFVTIYMAFTLYYVL